MANGGAQALAQQIDHLFQAGTLSGLSDAELLERYLLHRDEAAFEALVRLHGPMVLGLCRRMLRKPQEAEDAFQATFLILVRKAPGIRDRRLLGNWLYGVAYRVATKARIKGLKAEAGRRPSDEIDEVADEKSHPSDHADWLPILDQELNRLPEKYRAPIVLCHLDGRTHEQSAGELGWPVGTVRSRLARGRDLLRRRLERRGVSPGVLGLKLGVDSVPGGLVETVSSSLVSATVAAAGRFMTPGAAAAIGAGAISSIQLAQGVISSMYLTQLKIVLFGFLTTTAVVCGAARGITSSSKATASAPRDSAPTDRPQAILAQASPPQLKEEPAAFLVNPTTDQAQTTTPRQTPRHRIVDEMALDSRSSKDSDKLMSDKTSSSAPIHELEAQLDFAEMQYLRTLRLSKEHVVSPDEAAMQYTKVRMVVGRLRDVYESLREERILLEHKLTKAKAETAISAARLKIVSTTTSKMKRINAKFSATSSDEEIAKADAEVELARAQESSSKADQDAIAGMIQLVEERLNSVRTVLARATNIEAPTQNNKAKEPAPARSS